MPSWKLIEIALYFIILAVVVIGLVWYFNKLIYPLKDIVLNAFLDKYQYKFVNYLKESADSLKQRNIHYHFASRFYKDNKNPLLHGAIVKLYQDLEEDPVFSAEIRSIIRLYGKRSIDDILYYIAHSKGINADPYESYDSYAEDHSRITYPISKEDEEKIKEMYNSGLPGSSKSKLNTAKNKETNQLKDAGIDLHRLDTSKLDSSYIDIVSQYYEEESK